MRIYRQKNILILNDGVTGHLRQSQALANILNDYFQDKGVKVRIEVQEVKFKNNRDAKSAFSLIKNSTAKFSFPEHPSRLRIFLKKDSYRALISHKPSVIISCGSSTALINFLLSRENMAKSIAIIRPPVLCINRFDLAIMLRHDRPPRRKNIVVTKGALNLINADYLKEQSQKLTRYVKSRVSNLYIGLLIGGNDVWVGGRAKTFHVKLCDVITVIKEIKSVAERLGANILVTTSRRTPQEVEELIKKEFKDYDHCKLLVIANEKNIPQAVGGIIGLSQIVIVSPDSISMISEAVTGQRYVFVFKYKGIDRSHERFLNSFSKNKYINLVTISDLAKRIENTWLNKDRIYTLKDNILVRQAIKKML